jgi:hypothetical protein
MTEMRDWGGTGGAAGWFGEGATSPEVRGKWGNSAVVKLNEKFSVAQEIEGDIAGVLMSLYSALTSDELAQVSVKMENAQLQLLAPPDIVAKIGLALGMPPS